MTDDGVRFPRPAPAAPRWLRGLLGLLVALLLGAGEADPLLLERVRQDLAAWIAAVGLSDAFEVRSLAWTAPDRPDERHVLRLDVRFAAAPGALQEAESERFYERLKGYRGPAGPDLGEALFHKLVRRAGATPADAEVVFRVRGEGFRVAFDPAQGQPVLRGETGTTRRYLLGSAPLRYGSSGAAGPGAVVLAADGSDLATRALRFLEGFFRAEGGTPGPRVTARPLEPNAVTVDVDGLHNVVVPNANLWERLRVSIVLQPLSATEVRALAIVDGDCAAGVRPPPAADYEDIERRHGRQLDAFLQRLLRALQQHMAGDGG